MLDPRSSQLGSTTDHQENKHSNDHVPRRTPTWSRGCEIAESSWLTDSSKTVAGADDTSAGDATKLKWEFDEDLGRYYVSFSDDQ